MVLGGGQPPLQERGPPDPGCVLQPVALPLAELQTTINHAKHEQLMHRSKIYAIVN